MKINGTKQLRNNDKHQLECDDWRWGSAYYNAYYFICSNNEI